MWPGVHTSSDFVIVRRKQATYVDEVNWGGNRVTIGAVNSNLLCDSIITKEGITNCIFIAFDFVFGLQ